jgi:hypothetical protein
MSSPAPPPFVPGEGPDATSGAGDAPARGCLRWGLVGCAVLSVVAIVGMVLFMRKAPQLMETLLGATEAQVVAAITPEVSREDRDAFREEYAAFVATAKEGSARPEAIQRLQQGIVEALKDGRVDAEELRGLTEQLRSMPKK